MKKRLIVLSTSLLMAWGAFAQEEAKTGYEFTTVKENPITPIKNQSSSGTCWSFSAVALLESELLKAGKGEYDLSVMYIVRRNYKDKAVKYTRVGGHLNFAQGGSFADVIETLDEYGVMPNEEYIGLNYGENRHIHGELEAVLNGYVSGVVANKNKKITPVWGKGFDAVLDTYLGVVPEKFISKGKTYTPQSFAQFLGLSSSNFVSLSSFTHHPFYQAFAMDVADNWRWAPSYNLPLDELMKTIDTALENGHTVAWATDVSEVGFTRDGLAVMPDDMAAENIGSDQAHWLGLSPLARNNEMKKKVTEGPMKEKEITQQMRQEAYDSQETTDDHGMLIYGTAKDQNGTKYYLVKNSWGEVGKYKGIWYASEAFVRYKTISVVINKKALSKETAKKLKF